MKKKFYVGLIMVICMSSMTDTVNASSVQTHNVLINGSFESPVLLANSAQTATPSSWLQADSSPSLINGVFLNYPVPQDGQQYIGIGVEQDGTPDGISQGFTITDQAKYVLSWYDTTPLGEGTSSPYSVTIFDSVDQVILATDLDAYSGTLDWILHSEDVILSPGAYTLRLQANPPIGHVGACLDNVILAPVPIPAAAWLLGSGLIGLAGIRRVKREKK